MRKPVILALSLALGAGAGDLAAQAAHVRGDDHPHADGGETVDAETLAQIERVEGAVRELGTTSAAQEAGFRPRLGLIPTMGTHWVNTRRMLARDGFDMERPEHLMFAPIDGEDTLVGVAYAYQARPEDEEPDAFHGDLDQWHAHPELSPPGRELTMLHVWFVPSPDGPFAGHNPWLPYMVVGLAMPEPARLEDPDDSYRLRALALALAETVAPLGPTQALERLGDLFPSEEVDRHREAIAALIPRLDAAEEAGDTVAWNEAADLAVAEWEAIRRAYLDAVPMPAIRDRLAAFYEEMLTGAHAGHGM